MEVIGCLSQATSSAPASLVPVPAWSTSSTAPSSTRARRSSCWGVLIIWAQCSSLKTLTMSINKNVTFCKSTNVNKLLIYWYDWCAELNTTLSERYSYRKIWLKQVMNWGTSFWVRYGHVKVAVKHFIFSWMECSSCYYRFIVPCCLSGLFSCVHRSHA